MITLEMGKLISQAEAEIILSADILDYYADNAEKFLADKTLDPTHTEQHSSATVLSVYCWV